MTFFIDYVKTLLKSNATINRCALHRARKLTRMTFGRAREEPQNFESNFLCATLCSTRLGEFLYVAPSSFGEPCSSHSGDVSPNRSGQSIRREKKRERPTEADMCLSCFEVVSPHRCQGHSVIAFCSCLKMSDMFFDVNLHLGVYVMSSPLPFPSLTAPSSEMLTHGSSLSNKARAPLP